MAARSARPIWVLANNKRSAWQGGPRGWFDPRKALWCARRRSPFFPMGIDAPTTARVGTCRPMGFSLTSVPEGFQRASGKPFGAPAGAVPFSRWGLTRRLQREFGLAVLWVFRQLRCPKVSKGRAESPLVRPQAHTPCPGWGGDAPTTAREQGLQPYGAFTLFFRWRKKSVQKKASGTATPGKRLLLPILTAGLVMSRAA